MFIILIIQYNILLYVILAVTNYVLHSSTIIKHNIVLFCVNVITCNDVT